MYITNMIAIYVNINVLAVRILMGRQHCVGKRVRTKGLGCLNLALGNRVNLTDLLLLFFWLTYLSSLHLSILKCKRNK